MHKHKMRIRSDRYDEHMDSMKEYGMEDMGMEAVPVDLYGKRVFKNKTNKSNLTDAAEDIKEYYDLEGNLGLEGGD